MEDKDLEFLEQIAIDATEFYSKRIKDLEPWEKEALANGIKKGVFKIVKGQIRIPPKHPKHRGHQWTVYTFNRECLAQAAMLSELIEKGCPIENVEPEYEGIDIVVMDRTRKPLFAIEVKKDLKAFDTELAKLCDDQSSIRKRLLKVSPKFLIFVCPVKRKFYHVLQNNNVMSFEETTSDKIPKFSE